MSRPGDFRDLCDIEQPSEADGDPVPAFDGADKLPDVPCDVVFTGGSETFRGRGIEPQSTYVVEMHHYTGITPRMRLRVTHGIHARRILNIRAVANIDQNAGRAPRLQLDCAEEVST